MRMISIALLALLIPLAGCQLPSEKLDKKLKPGEPRTHVFFAKYEDVEAALKLAMLKYPQRVDNTEAGIFETDFVKGEARFKPAHKPMDYSSGYRYRILIRLVKGKVVRHRQAVEVVVLKQIEQAPDFFADATQIQSDGLEESVILYRIGREITIAHALQKAADKQNKNPNGTSPPPPAG